LKKGKAGIESSGTKCDSMFKSMKQEVARLRFNNTFRFSGSRTPFLKVSIFTMNMSNYSNPNKLREYFVQ
jgi:hypothetical protein